MELARGENACTAGPGGVPLRILVVEDNETNRFLEAELVRHLGHEATTACDGREALQVLAGCEFDLILMNISMPVMGGLKATARIRRGEVPGCPSDVPIVAMTAHAMGGDRERFLGCGMDDYLSKPFALAELEVVLRRWQRSVARPTGAGRAPAAPSSGSCPPGSWGAPSGSRRSSAS